MYWPLFKLYMHRGHTYISSGTWTRVSPSTSLGHICMTEERGFCILFQAFAKLNPVQNIWSGVVRKGNCLCKILLGWNNGIQNYPLLDPGVFSKMAEDGINFVGIHLQDQTMLDWVIRMNLQASLATLWGLGFKLCECKSSVHRCCCMCLSVKCARDLMRNNLCLVPTKWLLNNCGVLVVWPDGDSIMSPENRSIIRAHCIK